MGDLVNRLPEMLRPEATRTVLRPFVIEDPTGGNPRTRRVIDRVLALQDEALRHELRLTIDALKDRHRDVDRVLERRYEDLVGVVEIPKTSADRRKLIAAYFVEEFSFESAALFNPSVVRHPDQSGVEAGALRILVSLRGIGEGHISSLVFRCGIWRAGGAVAMDEPSPFAVGPRIAHVEGADGELIVHLVSDGAEDISETVIYPFMPSQGRGVEDARLVEFTDDDGAKDYRATFTGFNGSEVRQALLSTKDFKTFEGRGARGDFYTSKGMALFPRKVDGRFMALGRKDNENIWLISSDSFDIWNGGEIIISPKWPWEFIQMGNCGSPIELDEGWLVLTHGVGAVRNYCIGACLLDKANPNRLLARTTMPLLEPTGDLRDGYVPNVVYSCGSLLRDRTLLFAYGVADNFAAFATIEVDALLKVMD
jgi:predicted GH43/DUF377 family glycosyl hydrolase